MTTRRIMASREREAWPASVPITVGLTGAQPPPQGRQTVPVMSRRVDRMLMAAVDNVLIELSLLEAQQGYHVSDVALGPSPQEIS